MPTEIGPTWQELVDAVVQKQVQATMILENSWKSVPKNAEDTKVVGEYCGGTPAVVIVREDLDEAVCAKVFGALLAWIPKWDGGVYGPFRPFRNSDIYSFFHELDALAPGM